MYNKKAVKYYEEGREFHQNGKLSAAERAYKKAIRANHDFVEAHNNLGNVFLDSGRLKEAAVAYTKALKLLPAHPVLLNNLGNVLQLRGENEKAISWLNKAIANDPGYADAYSNLGNALAGLGRFEKAAASYRQAITISPGLADAYNNLGGVLRKLGELDDAVTNFLKAIGIDSEHKEAHNGLGNALKDQGRLEEAITSYRRAIKIDPKHKEACNGLGNALKDQGRPEEAVASYRRAIEIDPEHKEAYNGLGNALKDQGRLEDAIASYRRAIGISPNNIASVSSLFDCFRLVCDWKNAKITSDRLDKIQESTIDAFDQLPAPPFINLYREADSTTLLNSTREWCDYNLHKYYKSRPFSFLKNGVCGRSKIRVGYISHDFRDHPVGLLVHNLFQHHDRNRFQIYTYSYGPDDGSDYRQSVISGSDYYCDITDLDHLSAAKKVFDDQIDILVDLTGFTRGGRYEICAYKPAPIQINYLGFPGSSGSDHFDYVITDWTLSPAGYENSFSEKLIRLPDCYQVNSQEIQLTNYGYTRANFALPDDAIIFCSFNNPRKIDEHVFRSWMRILSTVDRSVLWLIENNEQLTKNLSDQAKRSGVDPSRLIFSKTVPLQEHMERHALADIALDPFSYNGGITTSLSLHANVPVVTLQGGHYISRMSSSLLRAVSLSELIAHSVEEYEEIVIRLAKDRGFLSDTKSKLAFNTTNGPLFNASRFCENIEKSFVEVCGKYIDGESPAHIDIK
ncbi:MAG: tetratricopeptide repeat protein [Candidatus Sedimenticola sp. (ex Thyasira tokunagai)]